MKITLSKTALRSLEKFYWREARKTLIKVRENVLAQAEHSDPETLRLMVPSLLQSQPMVDQLVKIWGKVGGQFAYLTDQKINSGKKAAKKPLTEHEANMRAYAYQRSLLKARKILDTEAQAINRVIDKVVKRSLEEGLSIPNTRNLMKDMLTDELTTIENYQAERIARTEVVGAGNTGSFEAAKESGIELKKEWLHSGIIDKNTRMNHVGFGEMGLQDMDFEYAPGLQFPGDENADADEIINCRCGIVYDTGD